jgi:hypothetical protein
MRNSLAFVSRVFRVIRGLNAWFRVSRLWRAVLLVAVGAGLAPAVSAGAFKCLQPDGSIVYQGAACDPETPGEEIPVESGPAPGGKAKDYSIEGQIKALEAQRKKPRAEPDRAKRKSGAKGDGPDRAKCAKHRAEVARWQRATKGTYHDEDERQYREQKLEEHRALVERYCGASQ